MSGAVRQALLARDRPQAASCAASCSFRQLTAGRRKELSLLDVEDVLPLVFAHLSHKDAVALGGSCRAARAVWQLPASACFADEQALKARFSALHKARLWLDDKLSQSLSSLRDYHLLEICCQLCKGLVRCKKT